MFCIVSWQYPIDRASRMRFVGTSSTALLIEPWGDELHSPTDWALRIVTIRLFEGENTLKIWNMFSSAWLTSITHTALIIKYRRYDVKIWNMNRHVTFKDQEKNHWNDSPDPATISKHAAIFYVCKWCHFTMLYEWNVPSCGKININKASVIWSCKNTLETFCDITSMQKYPIPHIFTVHHIDEFIVIIKSIKIAYILWAFIVQVISQITI